MAAPKLAAAGSPAKASGKTSGKTVAKPVLKAPSNHVAPVTDTDVSSEMSTSFLEYAMSVIVSRALPDVRDGLKPVHRRILYSLYTLGLRPNTAHVKCVRVVGDCMGKFHPHGDSSIYEALVRLAQEWSLRVPLVDGHGNFGSLDDGPAAARYTECRMAPSAMSMVEELGEDTVDMRPNFDGSEQEPDVMPSAFPNLLVNGATGIAVGMATNMAPHNLGEVTAALQAMLLNPKISLDELMTFVPGPDLPCGAVIVGLDGVQEAYRTGRGMFTMRAVASVADTSARRKGIIVTELPYGVGPERVVARIKELVNAKKLTGVADVKDFSDRKTGLRLVIECKTGFNPHAVLDELYRLTPLQENFSVNNVALVDGQPQTLGLRDLCQLFLAHRLSVVKRRCEFRLRKALARVHILEGLVKALAAIDEVVAVIKKSKDAAEARLKLQKVFDLSVIQSEAILEMALRRLTSLEVTKLKDEMRELNKDIAYLSKLIASEKALKGLVGEELDKTSTAFSTARRTKLLNAIPASALVAANLEVPDEPCVVVLSSSGLVGRFEASSFTGRPSKHDVLVSQVITTNRAQIGLVTARGSLLRLSVLEIPVANTSSRGLKVNDVFDIASGDSPVGLVDARPGSTVSLITLQGLVKRIETAEFPLRTDARPIIGLKPDDLVVFAVSLPSTLADAADLFLVTSDAQLLRFPAKTVATKGLPAGGMAGIRLGAKAFVLAGGMVDGVSSAVVVTVSDAGALKVSLASDYPAKGRGTGGVRCQTFRKNESHLTAVAIGSPVPVALAANGSPVSFKDERSRRDGPGVAQATGIAGFGFLRSID